MSTRLKNIINGRQVVSLLHESDTVVSLSLLDLRTGIMRRVDIGADLATLPDEALLSVQVSDVREPQVHLSEWWAKGDISVDNGMFPETDETDLPPTWMVTPDGQEFDLRAHAGGLF